VERVRVHHSKTALKHVVYKIVPHLFNLFEFEQNVRDVFFKSIPRISIRRKNEGRFSLFALKI